MSRKPTFFTGQPVLSQLLTLIPRSIVAELVQKHKTDRYCKTFKTWEHLVCMLYQGFHQCLSLRDLLSGLDGHHFRLAHLGVSAAPARSTIADANKRRSASFFEELYHRIYKLHHQSLPDSRPSHERFFIIDSTTVSLFSNIMRGAGSYKRDGRKKGGIKAHMMLDAAEDIPSFVWLSEGRINDLSFLQRVKVPPNSFVVLDMAYINFEQFIRWDSEGTTWLTRQKTDAYFVVNETHQVNKDSVDAGVLLDQSVILGRPSNELISPLVAARRIEFKDTERNRTFTFITNNTKLPPEEIAAAYKRRWQIELVFKRIKQRYPLKYFLGESENAIRIQVWASLLCDLLLQIVLNSVNRGKGRKWSYANFASLIRQHLMTYMRLTDFLRDPKYLRRSPQKGTLFDVRGSLF